MPFLISRGRPIHVRGLLIAAAVCLIAIPNGGHAAEVKVAAAANFTAAAKEIGAAFEATHGERVLFSFGSTGQLFAQISQGAPFDVYLAADQARPRKAIDDGYAVAGTRVTYATGRIVLYSRDPGLVRGPETLRAAAFDKIAVANPATAPYGAAAMEAMRNLSVFDTLRSKLVQGNNIAQTYQFVVSGSAQVGFVALAQIAAHDNGSRWLVPATLYSVIAQDGVLLTPAAKNSAARAFMAFLQSPAAENIKHRFGYGSGD